MLDTSKRVSYALKIKRKTILSMLDTNKRVSYALKIKRKPVLSIKNKQKFSYALKGKRKTILSIENQQKGFAIHGIVYSFKTGKTRFVILPCPAPGHLSLSLFHLWVEQHQSKSPVPTVPTVHCLLLLYKMLRGIFHLFQRGEMGPEITATEN